MHVITIDLHCSDRYADSLFIHHVQIKSIDFCPSNQYPEKNITSTKLSECLVFE